jgi:hypothetical protein
VRSSSSPQGGVGCKASVLDMLHDSKTKSAGIASDARNKTRRVHTVCFVFFILAALNMDNLLLYFLIP